ncbi:DUF421 domain-containing protein [Phycisphaera mikurensis]|uniref:YetF C-terminal domain-containing protein n=1 Tax=Phycisphaera mikurensis (strain NBRC 102666 / KCTC 22515 / FYK2301M01) TaxID=1142394 RepID=I0IDE5_PHYMF|nr:YetF domain-containing protein [Phycisphaera mikurensis]MBB6443331.1 uncharacterized membrane protein YcaP (DUF421 family) [Phycisphaera mikurensis]BAM03283.1 hypothetical protein PSMK_11240 [Phycisphaera mikurensis NBRC 102666]
MPTLHATCLLASAPGPSVGFWSTIFGTSWSDAGRLALTALAGYAVLVAMIRLFGKRTTSRMNNFDWIVTVAIGTIFATTLIRDAVPLSDGLLAILLLLVVQFAVTQATARSAFARRLFLSPPRILCRAGVVDERAMRRERVSRSELESAVRAAGLGRLGDAAAVVLESDATLAVVKSTDRDRLTAFRGVRGFEPPADADGR